MFPAGITRYDLMATDTAVVLLQKIRSKSSHFGGTFPNPSLACFHVKSFILIAGINLNYSGCSP